MIVSMFRVQTGLSYLSGQLTGVRSIDGVGCFNDHNITKDDVHWSTAVSSAVLLVRG